MGSQKDCDDKIARPQESQSFTAYTISKEQYDSWEWVFVKLWYNQADQHARIWLASLARVLRFALPKIFENKSVSQLTRNAMKSIEMPKKFLPLWPITRFARSANPERRSAMKFLYNQSDLRSNTFTKSHQNLTNSYRDISFNSRTDRQREPRSRGEREGQIIVSGVTERLWR